jgi:tetratricopeptide (TPR) repeat protein
MPDRPQHQYTPDLPRHLGDWPPEGSELDTASPPARRAAQTSWNLFELLEHSRKVIINLVVISVGAILLLVIWRSVTDDSITMEPIAATKEVDENLGGENVGQRLLDRVRTIIAVTIATRGTFFAESHADLGKEVDSTRILLGSDKSGEILSKINVPESGVSLQAIATLLRSNFGPPEVRLGGNLTMERAPGTWAPPAKYLFLIRLDRGSTRQSSLVQGDSLDEVLQKTALRIIEWTDPFSFGLYHHSKRAWDDMDAPIRTLLAEKDEDKRKLGLVLRAMKHAGRKEHPNALRDYQHAVDLDPRFADAHLALANTYMAMATPRPKDAFKTYRRAAELATNPAPAYRLWAIAARDHVEAEDCAAELALDVAAVMPEPMLGFFGVPLSALAAEPCHELAIGLFQRARTANPLSASTYNSWGILHARRQEYDRAIQKYSKALDIDDRYALALTNWALALKDKARDNREGLLRAAKKFEESLAVDPKATNTYIAYARLLEKLGDKEAAIQRYEQALATDPEKNKYLKSRIEYLKRPASPPE